MKRSVAGDLKRLDVEIGRKMFDISKENKMSCPPSPLQGRILDYLRINQGRSVNQKQLEEQLDVSKTTISNALLAMEKNGIIERVQYEDDARNKEIKLTDKSVEIFDEMSTMFEILNKEMLVGISEEELDSFYNVIEKIEKNIRRKE